MAVTQIRKLRKKLDLTEDEWKSLQDLTDVAKKDVDYYGEDMLEITAIGDVLCFHGTGTAAGIDSVLRLGEIPPRRMWHAFYAISRMKEEITIGDNKVWILIEPHRSQDREDGEQREYFTASYSLEGSGNGPGAVLFLEDNITPKRFESPVQALEFASEKLRGMTR
jgi:hypothetical protein